MHEIHSKIRPVSGQDQLETYLRSDRILAVGRSWMAKRSLITDGRFDEIAQLTLPAPRIVADIRSRAQLGEKNIKWTVV